MVSEHVKDVPGPGPIDAAKYYVVVQSDLEARRLADAMVKGGVLRVQRGRRCPQNPSGEFRLGATKYGVEASRAMEAIQVQ